MARVQESYIVDPTERDAHYGKNMAQYLVDLHDAQATFNFCGGMLFQLVLSAKLRERLLNVAASNDTQQQPIIFRELTVGHNTKGPGQAILCRPSA